MNRDEALALLHEWTTKDGLRKHALAVEAAMRAYARHFGEDESRWGVVGLLHDFDYERFPDAEGHPWQGAEELRRRGWAEDDVRAVLGHADYTGIPRTTRMARVLFAVDELAGLLTAAALVQPDRRLESVTVASVRKKMKDKAFARSVSRTDILRGAEELGVDLNEHIEFVRQAMLTVADRLGL